MRRVINISLPSELAKFVEKTIKTGQYATKSEFFRSLLRDWMERKLLKEIEESRKEITSGKGKVLKSFKDLD